MLTSSILHGMTAIHGHSRINLPEMTISQQCSTCKKNKGFLGKVSQVDHPKGDRLVKWKLVVELVEIMGELEGD